MKRPWIFMLLNLFAVLTQAQVKPTIKDTAIYLKVDVAARYPGGQNAFSKFIGDNITLPNEEAEVKGPITISFVVEKDGRLSDCKVLRGFTPAVNAEFIRVIKMAAKWAPGKIRGKAVRQQYFVSMTFESGQKQIYETAKGVASPAEYPGGMAKFYNYLSGSLKYPAKAKADKVQGRVTVSFIIDTDGSLTDIKIEKSLSPETDAEVIRLINESKKWKPGQQNGHPIKQIFRIAIPFEL